MRIYLSGPISSDSDFVTHFSDARNRLEAMGYEVVNPAELIRVVGKSFTYDEVMRIDLDLLIRCDVLVQLPGWERSRGANIEYGFALGAEKSVMALSTLLQE